MVRILAELLLAILLPGAVYLLWLVYERNRAAALGRTDPLRWEDVPVVWLALAGFGLAAVLLVATAFLGETDVRGRYVPPELKDGRIVPGHVEPQADPAR